MPECKVLAERTKIIRKVMDENQMDFSYHCGICVETLSLIEREKADPRLSTLQKIAAYSNITVSELLSVDYTEEEWNELYLQSMHG